MLSQELPADKGVYVLRLYLDQTKNIDIGALGKVSFPGGDFLYVGSAFGSGGIRARLGRHLRGKGTRQWHIDVLRSSARPLGYCYYTPKMVERNHPAGDEMPHRSYECRWSQALVSLPEVSAPVPGFGASDCRSGCVSHLLMINPSQNSSGINIFKPKMIETLAMSLTIDTSDLRWIQYLPARDDYS